MLRDLEFKAFLNLKCIAKICSQKTFTEIRFLEQSFRKIRFVSKWSERVPHTYVIFTVTDLGKKCLLKIALFYSEEIHSLQVTLKETFFA